MERISSFLSSSVDLFELRRYIGLMNELQIAKFLCAEKREERRGERDGGEVFDLFFRMMDE